MERAGAQDLPEFLIFRGVRLTLGHEDAVVPSDDFVERVVHRAQEMVVRAANRAVGRELDHRLNLGDRPDQIIGFQNGGHIALDRDDADDLAGHVPLGAEGGLHPEARAILAEPPEVARRNRAALDLFEEALVIVALGIVGMHQFRVAHPDEFGAVVAVHLKRLVVRIRDGAVGVADEAGVHLRDRVDLVEQVARARPLLLDFLGDIARDGDGLHDMAGLVGDRQVGGGNPQPSPVLRLPGEDIRARFGQAQGVGRGGGVVLLRAREQQDIARLAHDLGPLEAEGEAEIVVHIEDRAVWVEPDEDVIEAHRGDEGRVFARLR